MYHESIAAGTIPRLRGATRAVCRLRATARAKSRATAPRRTCGFSN
jgi:hypothetical protein